eukprot:m.52175 g.52175  ORF g.52175 m.52175 type:complete len:177 (-) comp21556_c0_seq1:442-972(-)
MSRRGEAKISSELFTLTYGSLVAQLIKDYEEDEEVNIQLEKMGYNIGTRLIDDFLANATQTSKCTEFRETADVVAKVGFKMFLGIVPTVTNWSEDFTECSLILDENPLATFVELPSSHKDLNFSNLLCGVLRGALMMVQMRTDVWFKQDVLKGDPITEIRLKLHEIMVDEAPPSDE